MQLRAGQAQRRGHRLVYGGGKPVGTFALRNYGTQHGQLYKPEQMDIAGMITGTEKNATLRLSELSAADGTVDASSFWGWTT